MEDAQGVLVGRDVAAQGQVELVGAVVRAAADGGHGVVRRVTRVRDDTDCRVVPAAPEVEHAHGSVEQLATVRGHKAQDGKGPADDAAGHVGGAGDPEGLSDLGLHHREDVAAALEVVVGEDRASHDRQVGIGAHEVVRKGRDEIEQTAHVLAVDVHGAMLGAYADAVLLEIGIGAVLQAPGLPAQLDGDQAQVLTGGMASRDRGGAARIALVLEAELAGGILDVVRGSTGGRDVARVLLGLGLVDRDLQVAPGGGSGPGDVARDGRAADVVDVAAEAVEPVGRLTGARRLAKLREGARDLGRPRHQRAHDPHVETVAAGR